MRSKADTSWLVGAILLCCLTLVGAASEEAVSFEVVARGSGRVDADVVFVADTQADLDVGFREVGKDPPDDRLVDFDRSTAFGWNLGTGGCSFLTEAVEVSGQVVTLVIDIRLDEPQCPAIDRSYFQLLVVAPDVLPAGVVQLRAVSLDRELMAQREVRLGRELPSTGGRERLQQVGVGLALVGLLGRRRRR